MKHRSQRREAQVPTVPVPGTPKREAKAKESWRGFHHAGGGKGPAMASRMAMVGGNLEISMQRKRCKTTGRSASKKHGEAFRFERRRTVWGENSTTISDKLVFLGEAPQN